MQVSHATTITNYNKNDSYAFKTINKSVGGGGGGGSQRPILSDHH